MTPSDLIPNWQAATTPPGLEAEDVQIWYLPLALRDVQMEQCLGVLGLDEHQRAAKFAFPYLRQRYIAAHGMVRLILASLLNSDPQELEFRFGERGKPFLNQGDLRFNLSHSGEHGLLAITRLGEIGVDLESVDRKIEFRAIAERFFSARESAELFSLSPTDQRAGFFNLWTRKEAWLKATGIGISEGLSGVEFNCRPGEPARLLRIDGESRPAERWHVQTFETPAEGHVGSLAMESVPVRVNCFRWE